jgi:hypothetical protein
MIVLRNFRLIAIALFATAVRNQEHKRCSAVRKIAAKPLLATLPQLCILRLHPVRRLKKRPTKDRLSLGQHVREDDNALPRFQ